MNKDKHSAPRRTDRASHSNIDLNEQLKNLRKPLSGDTRVSSAIDPMVQEGELYTEMPEGKLQCYACAHRCVIRPGLRGICQVRYNADGKLFVPWGYVGSLQCDPTEKKPFYHLYPGSDTLTFGMLGCDLHCSYCQNWDTSQTLRDANAGYPPQEVSPEQLVMLAQNNSAKCVASSYNEPLITSEWAVSVFRKAKEAGFTCMFISNGNATKEVLEYIKPFTDGYKIDLKSMKDKRYRKLGTKLESVLEGIRIVHQMGFWMEIVTLIVPGFNDSEEELREAARFLKSVSPDIPWHVTAFHTDYKMQDKDNTSANTLIRAAEIGYGEGLNFVYAGNLPGRVKDYEHTYCPGCSAILIKRFGYVIMDYRINEDGLCPECDTRIPGIWPKSHTEVRMGDEDDLFIHMPRMVR